MTITNFIPELWSAALLTTLKKTLVYGSSPIANRDYQGQIRGAGDSVTVTQVGRVTVNNYTRNSDISYELLDTAQRKLVIDQEKYWAFEIDDVDAAQVLNDGGLVSESMTEAAYALADTADQHIAGLYTQAHTDNVIGTTAVTSADLAYDALVSMWTELATANVPTQGRWVVVPPWFYALLLDNDRFVTADSSGTTEGLRNAAVGRAVGFDIYLSNNVPLITGDDYAIIFGAPGAISYAEQIVNTEALRSEVRFSDRMRGLHVYGAKVIDTRRLGYMTASVT